ncbi:MAG TPA: BTAD domain-containing putative transcriptional regulator, partial [Rubrobacter sp.]|nr:BTAD domain-containing putative transcriptional regulator [Rubrobacter sp.]
MKRGHNSRQLPREGLSGPQEVVRLKLLGGFRVTIGDRAIAEAGWRLRKAASLVKLLALAPGRRLHREQVMDALWPDLGRRAASNNLRQILHVARKALDPNSASRCLIYRDGQLLLCPEGPIRVDVDAFEEAAATARRLGEPAGYRAAIDLYAGDLLPADRYEDWAEERRSELRRTFISLLVELASIYEQQREYGPSIETLERAVAGEPLHEEARVALMRVHALAGSPAEALKQYERLEHALYRELGSRPEASSRLLREEIAAGRFPPRETSTTSDSLSAKARTHNLPAVRTKLVGREREMLEIKRELAMTRLLTLTGVGGSGKTRLALEVARDLTGAYPDGVWLAELAPLSEGMLVPGAVAEALGIKERAGQSLVDTLVEAVRPRETLLVLDNCEHVVEQAARLSEVLLDACPGLRILATSREALGVAGEVRWVVPALTTPGLRRSWSVEELEEYESARLFAERARQRDPSFTLTAARAQPVAQICTRLEGIPLAIELAAARVGMLGTAQISERLEDSIGLLTTTVHTAVPRQRTLRSALDWSHELLSADE